MKKNLYLSFTVLLLSLSAAVQAQTTFSKKLIDSLELGIQAHGIAPTLDHGYLIAGISKNKGLVIKVDSLGNLIWNKTFGSSTDLINFNAIIVSNDSSFVIAGNNYNAISKHSDACCLKINPSENIVWFKTFNPNNSDVKIYSLIQSNDSGYMITGMVNPSSAFTAKLDINGNPIWNKLLSLPGNACIGYSVKQNLKDSSYMIIGNIEKDILLVRLSAVGALLWAKKYNIFPAPYSSGNDLIITNDGIICYVTTNKYSLMKTDFSGNVKWAKSYQSIISGPNCLDCPAPGLYGGADSSYYFINGNCLAFGRIIRTDIKGNIIWAKGLGLIPMEIINVKDKGFLILGNGPLCGIAPGSLSSQIGIIKTDSAVNSPDCIFNSNANMANDSMFSSAIILNSINSSKDSIFQPQINSISISAYPGCVNTIPGIKETKLNTMITLYPNPSKGIFTLKTSEAGPSEIFIYNSLGEMIYQSEMNSRQLQIDLIAKARGIYFYKVILADKKIITGKFVIVN